jgi:hypothetical protein
MSRPLAAAATSTPLRPALPPLLVAASKNDVASLRTILAALPAEAAQPAPRSVTYRFYCALLVAVRLDSLAFARCLLEDSVFHIPLQQVRLQGEGEDAEFQSLNAAVQTLSRAQMPVFSDIRNIASALDRTEMCMLLVKARPREAESMCLSSDGHSPALRCVHLCARDNQPALLGALVDAGVDLNAATTGNHRRSPLDRYVLRRASDGDHFISPDIRCGLSSCCAL